jgi:hypothetical protein
MDFDEKTLILGIGAQKTGTTWLYNYLARRPDVFMSPQKELHYFDIKYRPELSATIEKWLEKKFNKLKERRKSDLTSRQRKVRRTLEHRFKFHNDDAAYKEYFRWIVPPAVNFYGEITPSYAFVNEDGFRSIRQLFPHIRIVFIMRDPVERFYSQIRHVAAKKADPSHAKMIRKHIDDPDFLERSSYEKTIRHLDTIFDKSEVVYLFYENLFEEKAIKVLCEAIGVEYREPKFERVLNSSVPRQEIPENIYGRLREKLEPTYAFCLQRFGDRLPKNWDFVPAALRQSLAKKLKQSSKQVTIPVESRNDVP